MGVSRSRGHASHGRVLDSGLRTDARVHPFLTDRANVYRDGACLDRWGVKVTTLALLVLLLLAQVRGQEDVSAFGRRISRQLIQKVLVVLSISALVVILATLAIMISDGLRLVPAIFEVTSAFGTVGLSMQVTQELSTFAKLVIIGVMFFGRVGPITLVLALAARKRRGYIYPLEDIAIG